MADIGFITFYRPGGRAAFRVPAIEVSPNFSSLGITSYVFEPSSVYPTYGEIASMVDFETPSSIEGANESNSFYSDRDPDTGGSFAFTIGPGGGIEAVRLLNGAYAARDDSNRPQDVPYLVKLANYSGKYMMMNLLEDDNSDTGYYLVANTSYRDILPEIYNLTLSPTQEVKAAPSKLFITSPEGYNVAGPAGGIQGNPIDQGTIFLAEPGQTINFTFAMLYSDGSVDENIEAKIIPPLLPGAGGVEVHWFDVVGDTTVVVDPLARTGFLLGSYAVLKEDYVIVSSYEQIDYSPANFFLQNGVGQGLPYFSIPGSSGIPSGPSAPSGNFPTDPGPSLVDKIPAGSAGNDIAQSGLYTKYLVNKGYMDLMGDILWEDNIVINALKELFGNPIDAVISCMSYPFNLVNFVNRTNQDLFFGHIDTNIPFIAVTKSSFQIDWGKIEVPFAWGNFLDYSPYTKVELFLPWGPGYVTIDPNDIMPYSNIPGNINAMAYSPGSIQVKTNIELDKGTCVHNVIGNNGRVIGSFSGIVGRNIPLTALDTAGKALATIGAVAAVATAGASTAATAASGGFNKIVHGGLSPMKAYSVLDPSAMASGFASNVGSSSAPNMASKAAFNTPLAYPRAGTFSDGSAAMTVQQPFLIISRPVQSVPAQYGHYNGYPSNIYYGNFNGIRGYTEISEIHLDNIGATTDELDELDEILKGGILL